MILFKAIATYVLSAGHVVGVTQPRESYSELDRTKLPLSVKALAEAVLKADSNEICNYDISLRTSSQK